MRKKIDATNLDAMKMVRRIRDSYYEKLKDKSTEERIAFFQEQSRALRKEARARKKEKEAA